MRPVNIAAGQDFFELIRRIEQTAPAEIRLGTSRDRYIEHIRITQPADFAFAAKEVTAVIPKKIKNKEKPLVIIVSRHFGLFAPYGPLPLFITEHAKNELFFQKNDAFQKLMTILSQRFAIFQYRAWAQLQVSVSHDKPRADVFQYKLDQIIGLAGRQNEDSDHIVKLRRAFPGSYFKDRMALPELQKIISIYFGIEVKISKKYPRWLEHEHNSSFVLGRKILGRKFYNLEHNALIELGPFRDKSYLAYDRGGDKLKVLLAVCNDFVNQLLSFTVILYVETNPSWRSPLGRLQIGKNSWLKPDNRLTKKIVFSPRE